MGDVAPSPASPRNPGRGRPGPTGQQVLCPRWAREICELTRDRGDVELGPRTVVHVKIDPFAIRAEDRVRVVLPPRARAGSVVEAVEQVELSAANITHHHAPLTRFAAEI